MLLLPQPFPQRLGAPAAAGMRARVSMLEGVPAPSMVPLAKTARQSVVPMRSFLLRASNFWSFAGAEGVPANSATEMVSAPTLGAMHLLSEGRPAGKGKWRRASIVAVRPKYSRFEVLGLPQLLRSINVWPTKAPGTRQLQLPALCLDAFRNRMHS